MDSYLRQYIYIYIYIYYLHFMDYCPILCRPVYHNVTAVVRSGLLQVAGMSNLTLYFAYRGRFFLFPGAMFNGCQLLVISC